VNDAQVDRDDAFEHKRQLAELDYLTSSRAAATALAKTTSVFPGKHKGFTSVLKDKSVTLSQGGF
jgi:hypothetical protein